MTGAAGLTGGAVVRELAKRGHEVVALVRHTDQRRLVRDASEHIVADCRDTAALAAALRGSDALVHGAGITLGEDVARAGLQGLRRVVVISTAAIATRAHRSRSVYLANERALIKAAPEAAILRPTMIYGSYRDRNVHHVVAFARRARFLPLVGDGKGLIQPIHYEDVSRATVELLLGDTRGPVAAGGATPLTIEEATRQVLVAIGLRPRLVRVPRILALTLARASDVVRRGRLAERVERMLEDRTVDNANLIAATGVHPRSFADGIRQQIKEAAL